jgi:hypothetical protein
VLALVVLALVLRWPRMTESIWYDEWCRTGAVLNAGNLRKILLHDVHNPAYNALMYVWISVFGDSEVSIRMPSLIAGLASLWIVCRWIAKRFDGGERLAWLVGLWGVCSPQHVWLSTEAKNNMFVVLAATCVMVAYSRLGDSGARRRTLCAIVAGAAALWVDWVTLLAIVPGLVWASRQPDCGPRRSGIVALGTVLAALPLILFKSRNVEDLWRDYLKPFRFREAAELVGSEFLTGNVWGAEDWHLGAALVALPLVLVLMVLGARRLGRSAEGRLVNATLVLGMLLMALAAALVDVLVAGLEGRLYQPRNLLLLLYPYGLVLLSGALALARGRIAVAAVVIGVTLASSIAMNTVHRDPATVMNPKPDWREIARLIEADAGKGRVVAWSRSPIYPLGYYLPGTEVRSSWGPPLDAGVLKELPAGAYVVDDRRWWPLGDEERVLLDDTGFARRFGVGHVDVYRAKR